MKKLIQLTILSLAFIACSQVSEEELKIQQEQRQKAIADSLEIVEQQVKELQHQKDMELIKTLDLVYFADRINIYEAMNAISGVEGTTSWEVSYPEEYKDKPHLCLIEGTSTGIKKKKEKTMYLKLLLNKETGQFEIKEAVENGKKIGKMELVMTFALSGAGIK